jgi:hypothetical protein
MKAEDGIDENVLEEGCYYLSKLDLGLDAIAERFEITQREAKLRMKRFQEKLKRGEAVENASDLSFWTSIKEEAEGNIKVTFVSDKGFHHAWRSDLKKLDGPALLSIYEACKHFLDIDPNSRFLEYEAPKNYDPIAMSREVSKAVNVIGSLLEEKWKEEKEREKGASR